MPKPLLHPACEQLTDHSSFGFAVASLVLFSSSYSLPSTSSPRLLDFLPSFIKTAHAHARFHASLIVIRILSLPIAHPGIRTDQPR